MTGEQLRALRTAQDLTQADLAAFLGISPNTLARYERGQLSIPEPVARLTILLQEKRNRHLLLKNKYTNGVVKSS